MKVLVTGGRGMLGHDLEAEFLRAGHEVMAVGRDRLDITSVQDCRTAVDGHDVVVNAAAWTGVDAAESDEAGAFTANATGVANIATACAEAGARLVQISTDYVFDGHADRPYAETDPLAPRSAYGRSKAAGEWAARALSPQTWVVRTAWLYGAHGKNFVKTMARLSRERETVSVVDDQRGQPTWTHDVAVAVRDLVEADAPYGVYHGTSSGETTWFGLAQEVFRHLGLDPERVRPTTTAAFPLPAPRPAYSVLGHDAWGAVGLSPLPDWRDALERSAGDVLRESR